MNRRVVYGLRTGHREDPLGVPLGRHLLTWAVGPEVEAGRFVVAIAGSRGQLTDGHGKEFETDRPWMVLDDVATSRTALHWQVRVAGDEGQVSGPAWLETGLADQDWTADWISGPVHPGRREQWDPPPLLRRAFTLGAAPSRARLYATALGLYRVWINGVEVTAEALLRPGWTDYRHRVLHQTYDCGPLLQPGRNVMTAVLAKGWYAGWVGLTREAAFYGDRPAFRAQLELDGTPTVVTDDGWRTTTGAIMAADLLRGEAQDLRQEPHGWHDLDFDDAGWEPVAVRHEIDVLVEPQRHHSPVRHRTHAGRVVREHGRGPVVIDFGQNLVGWTVLDTTTYPHTDVVVQHGEVLTPHDMVLRDNLRSAFQEDRYTPGDGGPHHLEPSFTLHGFRYAQVWGLPTDAPSGFQLRPDTTISAVSIEAGHPAVGRFDSSDERLNAFARAVEWTVRDNFIEVITDCPQRDERMGWLGDAGVIGPTAAYSFHIAAFVAKVLQDAADAQDDAGRIPDYVPAVPPAQHRPGAPGWADGVLRLAHLAVERYADLPTVDRHYDMLTRYLAFVDRANPDGLRINEVGADFGDWLSLPDHEGHTIHPGYEWTGSYSTTPRPIVDTAHSYRSMVQMAEIAGRLGRDGDRQRYQDRAEAVRQAYLQAFVDDDGRIRGATQTAYAQAVGFGLATGGLADAFVGHLADMVTDRGHVTTGIHGVQHVLRVLARHGEPGLAADLLLRDDFPSWLYMVGRGATTVWERWDAIRPDGALATTEMNSFNHCALGAVGQFLYEDVAGLDVSRTMWDGRVRVGSIYPAGLERASASHATARGMVESAWQRRGDAISHRVIVPGGVVADVEVPAGLEVRTTTGTHPDGPRPTLHLGPGTHDLLVEVSG